MGPLLFLIYINDIAKSSNLLKFILFADDTTVFFTDKNIETLTVTLNIEIDKVSNWLIANKLTINIKKTNLLIFKSRQKKLMKQNLDIKIKNQSITQRQSIKFLGVFVDQNLNWKEHIHTISGKISRSIGIISRSRFYLSQRTLFKLYYSLVYPYLYYGNIVWGCTYESSLKRLTILQKRAVRLITKSMFDAHTAPIFYEHKLLSLSNIYKLQVGIFMFSVENKLLPEKFQAMFHKNSSVHCYQTRQATHYRIPFPRTNVKKFTIVYNGPKFWNSLPLKLKLSSTMKTFKAELKTHLINLQ